MDITPAQVEDLLSKFVFRYGLRLHTIGKLIESGGALVLDGWQASYIRDGAVVPLKATLTATESGAIHVAATMLCRSCLKKN